MNTGFKTRGGKEIQTGEIYQILAPWLNGELVIIGHVND